jgi:catechol 2,3-dioxygenase-like lactoylglutathione lyase family enzyme
MMAVELNHIIVSVNDKRRSAEFLAGILGLKVTEFGPFTQVQTSNGVTLDFMDAPEFHVQHCAFLVSDDEFDASFARIKELGIPYWADPFHKEPGQINHLYHGRGVYFDDPSGHNMEILTQPYA